MTSSGWGVGGGDGGWGAKPSCTVQHLLMAVGSIPHSGPLSYFSLQPISHNWFNKGFGTCYPVCGMVHLLLNEKNSP